MSVVKLEVTTNAGAHACTGFVVHYQGQGCLIMTCEHNIQGQLTITVLLPGFRGRFHGATVLRSSPRADLALLHLSDAAPEFRPMIFAELPLHSLEGVVYCQGFVSQDEGVIIRPGRFPGQITGYDNEGNFTFLDGNFGSGPGTSGGPVTLRNRVIGVNQAAEGGSRSVISLVTVYMTLMAWCGFNGGDHTIAEMIDRLAP
ncbi:hypothetical protein ACQJBY_050014 [Aegilops geniculata]